MDKEDGMEWNGILCSLTQSYPTLCNPMNCSPPGKNFPGKNTGTGCHFLRGIFPTRGSNPSLLHRQVDSLPLHHVGSPSGISLSHKKGWTNAICSNVDGPGDYHTKSERERQTPCDTTYMWNLKYGHELIYKVEQTQMQRMKTCGCQGGGLWEGWMGSLRLADASYFT